MVNICSTLQTLSRNVQIPGKSHYQCQFSASSPPKKVPRLKKSPLQKMHSNKPQISLFDETMKKLNIVFKCSGLNTKHKIVSTSDFIKHRWLFFLNFTSVFLALIASFYYIFIGIKEGKSFLEVTSVAPCTIFSVLAVFKAFFLIQNEDKIFELIKLLQEMEKESLKENFGEKQLIVDEDIGFLNRVLSILYVLNVCMLIVFDITPLFYIGAKYYQTKEFDMLLPYLDVFAFMPYDLKWWLLAYFDEIWSEIVVLLFMGAADFFYYTCCTYIKIQFRLLKYDITRLISSKSVSTQVHSDEDFRERFCKLVKWHQDVIESSNLLELIYNKSTLLNFLSSSAVICLTGFNVTIVDDVAVFITFITFLVLGLMQVFFLCFFADMMMAASMEVSMAVYNCLWYLADNKIKQDLFLILIRSQKPCNLTAAGFADVNLNAFMRVLSTSWSYFALLQTVYKE